MPKETPKVVWEVTSTVHEMSGDLPVITKKLLGHVDSSAYPAIQVNIDLTLTPPANALGPVPVIMERSLGPEAMVAIAKRFPEFRQHRGGHTPGPNWPTFLTFAGRYL